jgi:hypothetical protein
LRASQYTGSAPSAIAHGLGDQQEVWAGPQPPKRREEHEHGVDVGAEPERLLAGERRDAQRVAVCGRPHSLHHVPEVEASGLERAMTKHRQRAEPSRERRGGGPDR